MSDEQIKIAIADRIVREGDPRRNLSGTFAQQEGEIIRQLHAMLRDVDRWEKERKADFGKPPALPEGFGSYTELVRFVNSAMYTPGGHDAFVAECAKHGISESDVGRILDRIEGGTFRAAAERGGMADAAPDEREDPVGYAAYMLAAKPRKWWQFWRW